MLKGNQLGYKIDPINLNKKLGLQRRRVLDQQKKLKGSLKISDVWAEEIKKEKKERNVFKNFD